MARCFSEQRLMLVDPDSRMSHIFREIDIPDKDDSATIEIQTKSRAFAQFTHKNYILVFCPFLCFLKSLLVSHHQNHLNHVFAFMLLLPCVPTHVLMKCV